MLSDERFNALLSGDKPKDNFEKEWLKNYREKQASSISKMLANDQRIRENTEQAYKEFYSLLKSTFPKDFFCKHPMSEIAYYTYTQTLALKIMPKVHFILNNPFLRKKYGIPPKNVNLHEHGYIMGLAEMFQIKDFNKKFKANFETLAADYEKYATPEFIQKAEDIESKYKVFIDYRGFDLELWCTDYAKYKDFKA